MNLLTDPLFRISTETGIEKTSLPQLLEAFGVDRVRSLPGIQRHQEDAFHVFLCCLAGAVLAHQGGDDPRQSAEFWRKGLRRLAGDHADEAWQLIGAMLDRPAFMQPPLPASDHERLRLKARTPDGLDLLVTSKNHDVKQNRARSAFPDEWIYALISLQTMSGYSGPGNQPISRMKEGYANRPIVELAPSLNPGSRWQHAVRRLLKHRQQVLSEAYGFDDHGLVLVWLEPWDGATGIPLSALDPLYIEICRRVRLKTQGTGIDAVAVPSSTPRISTKELKGVVGDAWLPIDLSGKKGLKSLSAPPQGLTVDLIRRLLFADQVKLSSLQEPDAEWHGDVWLTASVLVRGPGRTEGFHERRIRIPGRVRASLFGVREERDKLAQLSKTAVEYAGVMQKRVLKPAVFTYMEGAPESTQFDRTSAKAWWLRFSVRFESLWGDDFFSWLWAAEASGDDPVLQWAKILRGHALSVLNEAIAQLPQHTGRRYRARAVAELEFGRRLVRKNAFPFLRSVKEAKHHGA